MTTLREKILSIIDKYLDPNPKADRIMSAIKSKFGWTDEDCPFCYGEEIEVSDNGETWWTETFYFMLDGDEYVTSHPAKDGIARYKHARFVQKQEDTLSISASPNTIIEYDGKKYKLVEVE